MNKPNRAATPEVQALAETREVRWLETMKMARAYELKAVEVQQGGGPGTCTSVGQEACATGVVAALDSRDLILTNHRSAAHLISRGADPSRMLAEVLGRETGYCLGRSGSLHISAKELGVVLTSTIVGGELSMAPGVALAQKMGKGQKDGITAVFFGDGAACEGIFHESVNLAVVWELPVLFVCEDNHWQAFVHRDETMPANAIPNWARGHGIEVESVDGNDIGAVHAAAQRCVESIRISGKPRFLHLVTYRQRGHFEPDPQTYVNPEELDTWKSRDPITLLQSRLKETYGESIEALIAEMDARVEARIGEAMEFAGNSPWPAPEDLTKFVYA